MKKQLLFFLFFPFLCFSQYQVSGILTDDKTNEPLPFANVLIDEYTGTVTNIDGEFTLKSSQNITTIYISYIGYESQTITLSKNNSFLKIALTQNVESLSEVIVTSTENPALRIIRNAIENKRKNNIESALNTFQFNSYNKLLISANPDSISGELDSVFKLKKDGTKHFITIDSSNYEFKKQIDRSHIYMTEKISKYTFELGKKKKETILASRMAGLKQPLYEFLAITIQDFDFYDNSYTIVGTKYVNPIANNALKQYDYQILDTVKNSQGNSFMIYFKPKKKEDIIGLQGVLYIDDKSFALTSAIAELRGVIDIKATQSYKYIPENNIWFPIETHITIKKGKNGEAISLFGGAVSFSQGETKRDSTIIRSKRKGPEDVSYFSSKSTNFDIEINKNITVKKAANTIEILDDAYKKDEDFWNQYRTDSITKRGKETYVVMDSIFEEEGAEKKLNLARGLLNGYFPTKYINLDLGKIISYNNYEGFRVGFGGITNTNFSNKYRLESYVAFGTKDTDFKYKIGGSARLNRATNTWIGINYTDDLKESAAMNFISERNSFFGLNTRNLNLSDFFNYKTTNILFEHDILSNLETKLQLSAGNYKPTFNYTYISIDKLLQDYNLTTATIGIQYNPNSEYMNSPLGKMKIKDAYPQFLFQITKSFENVFESDFDFTRISLQTKYNIKHLRGSTTKLFFQGGIVFGQTPISHLFNHSPNYSYSNPWISRVTFGGNNSFETMGYNEFISDKFTMLQAKHEFKRFKISKRMYPKLSLVTRAAVGYLENPINHNGITIKTMEKGYFESGFELNSLFKGLGFNAFYRYGAYQNPVWSDNLSVKLTYTLSFGF